MGNDHKRLPPFLSPSPQVSYNWSECELPRSLAGHFPDGTVWLDVNKLVPGTAISDACRAAARSAAFRFVFLSAQYLESKNCRTEFAEITYSFDLFFVMRQQRKLVINQQIKLQHERLKQVKPRLRASPAVTLGVSKDLKSLFWSFFGPFPPHSFMVQ